MKLIIDIDERIYQKALKNKGSDKQLGFIDELKLETAFEKGTPLKEELEKIKAEIEDRYHKEMIKRHSDNGYDYQDLLLVGIDIGKNIVDNRIAELKGENNGE